MMLKLVAVPVVLLRDDLDYALLAVSIATALGTLLAVWYAVIAGGRDTRERKRQQATAVSAWFGSMEPLLPHAEPNTVVVGNGSQAAIYDVFVSFAGSWGAAKPDVAEYAGTAWISMLPPGKWSLDAYQNPGSAMDVRVGVLIEFTDAAGLRWKRAANGALTAADGKWRAQQRAENKPGWPVQRLVD